MLEYPSFKMKFIVLDNECTFEVLKVDAEYHVNFESEPNRWAAGSTVLAALSDVIACHYGEIRKQHPDDLEQLDRQVALHELIKSMTGRKITGTVMNYPTLKLHVNIIGKEYVFEVSKRSNDYHVQFESQPGKWGCGKTVLEALIGAIVCQYDTFGFTHPGNQELFTREIVENIILAQQIIVESGSK